VFGVHQRGANAVASQNVFYHLTYEGAVDIDAIEDNVQKAATIAQIENFGQTPVRFTLTLDRLLVSQLCVLLFVVRCDSQSISNPLSTLRMYSIKCSGRHTRRASPAAMAAATMLATATAAFGTALAATMATTTTAVRFARSG
jgi:hypothetical protein